MEKKLKRAHKIHFERIRDNEFVCYLLDDADNVILTFEPHEVFEGEGYTVNFGVPVVYADYVYPNTD